MPATQARPRVAEKRRRMVTTKLLPQPKPRPVHTLLTTMNTKVTSITITTTMIMITALFNHYHRHHHRCYHSTIAFLLSSPTQPLPHDFLFLLPPTRALHIPPLSPPPHNHHRHHHHHHHHNLEYHYKVSPTITNNSITTTIHIHSSFLFTFYPFSTFLRLSPNTTITQLPPQLLFIVLDTIFNYNTINTTTSSLEIITIRF